MFWRKKDKRKPRLPGRKQPAIPPLTRRADGKPPRPLSLSEYDKLLRRNHDPRHRR